MSVNIKVKKEDPINTDPPITFPYDLDTFQINAINSIESGNNVLVTAHTSAGKSTVAEYAIALAIKLNKKVIYTSPIKTLSNQKYFDFKKSYESVGILTGDVKQNPDAQVLVMTTEILRNMLFKNSDLINELFCVIFDEVHYINDTDRGHVWEETLIMIPNNIQIIMLSATIENSDMVCKWLLFKNKNIDIVGTKFRPVPLSHNIYFNDELIKVMGNDKKFESKLYSDNLEKFNIFFKKYISYIPYINTFVSKLEELSLMPCIFFSYSRKKCETYANMVSKSLINHEERRDIENIFNKYIKGIFKNYERLEQTQELYKLLSKGIGFHHSGLVHPLKEIQEILFSKGLIKILFATETFAVGVNMPAKCVVFTEFTKFDGSINGFRYLNTSEYLQMAGRAGRRGKDTEGTVIYFPLKMVPSLSEIRSILTGSSISVRSKLKLNTKFLLKVIESGNFTLSNFLEKSLLEDENKIATNGLETIYFDKKNAYDIHFENFIKNKEFSTEIDEYFKLVKEIEFVKQNKKRKNMQNRINSILEIRENKKQIDSMSRHIQLKNELLDYESKIKNSSLVNKLVNSYSFLNETGYITDSNKEISEIDRTLLSKKGLMASTVNECNEILLVELIESQILNDLQFEDIFALLSMFVDEKTEDEIILEDLEIPYDLKLIIQKIENMNNNLYRIALTNNLDFDCILSRAFVQSSYMWASQIDFKDIFSKCEGNIYEGNFVKNIIKVLNICNELVLACEITGNIKIPEILENIESKILRDIVSFESIYLHE